MIRTVSTAVVGLLFGATFSLGQTTVQSQSPESNSDTLAKMSSPAVATSTATEQPLVLTDEQAKRTIGMSIYSSDAKKIGEVSALMRDASGKVTELAAGLGGILSQGDAHVRIAPAQFRFAQDKVVLSLTPEQVKALPLITK